MVKDYYERVAGRITSDINHFSGGLNTYYDKAFIEDEQLPYAINVRMINPPVLETRPGRRELRALQDLGDVEIRDMWAYSEYEYYVIAYVDYHIKIYRFTKENSIVDNSWRRQDINENNQVPNETHYCFCYVKQPAGEWLYISVKDWKCKIPVGDTKNTASEQFRGWEDGHEDLLAWHKGRMFSANPETNIISFSAYEEPDNFIPDPQDADKIAGDFFVTNSKGKIVAIKSFDDKLIIFCEHSMHLLYGSTPDTSLSTQFQLVDMDNDLGAVAEECISIGSGRLYWLGSNQQIYEYTGSSITMISRPSDKGKGGIDGLIRDIAQMPADPHPTMASTYDKLYFNANITGLGGNEMLFVFDIFNRTWWCEDGKFITVADYNSRVNKVMLATSKGKIFQEEDNREGYDYLIDENNEEYRVPIPYIFQTKVYGATSVAGTKSIESIWFQARATADVYLNETWTLLDLWYYDGTSWTITNLTDISEAKVKNFPKIGTLKYLDTSETDKYYEDKFPTLEKYKPLTYEQQVCYVEKMFGQRVNAFSVVVKGEGRSKFFLMQRKWRINENV